MERRPPILYYSAAIRALHYWVVLNSNTDSFLLFLIWFYACELAPKSPQVVKPGSSQNFKDTPHGDLGLVRQPLGRGDTAARAQLITTPSIGFQ
eukprot:33001-Amphidinium_carterae.1